MRIAARMPSFRNNKREAWYREQLRRGIDACICHPKIVETGLDLLDFPTILFHETGYSLHTLRQASRRSGGSASDGHWKSNSSPHAGSVFATHGQEITCRPGHGGKFASEGLQAIDGDDDILTAMAREMVQNKGIGESADSVWRSLGALRPQSSRTSGEEPTPMEETVSCNRLPGTLTTTANSALAEAVVSHTCSGRRPDGAQLSLF